MVKKSTDDVKALAAFPTGGPGQASLIPFSSRVVVKMVGNRAADYPLGRTETDTSQTVERVYDCHHGVSAGAAVIGREAEEQCRDAEEEGGSAGRGERCAVSLNGLSRGQMWPLDCQPEDQDGLWAEVEAEADHRVESFVLVMSWGPLKTKLTTQGRASNITRVGASTDPSTSTAVSP
jgi:hypothetical protein